MRLWRCGNFLMNVFVTNRGDTSLTVGYDGVLYDFKKDVPIEISVAGARRLFGYGLKDREDILVRYGWIKLHSELEDGLKILDQFEITTEKPEKNSSLPSAVGVVPLHVEKRAGGKPSQRAA
mgnify:CR=1 FL=1